MCCGVAHNTYNTLDHMRLVLADGIVLDTADKDSCARFTKVCCVLCGCVIEGLGQLIIGNFLDRGTAHL